MILIPTLTLMELSLKKKKLEHLHSTQSKSDKITPNSYPPPGYQVDFPNPKYFKIKMKVDPCRSKGENDLCCDGTNDAVCEDNTSIISGTDIGVAWLMTGYVL